MILLVEDNRDDADLTVRAFTRQNLGGAIHVAEDGADALDYLLGTDETGTPRPLPDLVLLDLNLPRLGGHDVLRRLRATTRTALLPVVVLSSSVEERDVRDSYALGANGYVRKPVSFPEFMEAARKVGAYWLELNEPPPVPEGRRP